MHGRATKAVMAQGEDDTPLKRFVPLPDPAFFRRLSSFLTVFSL
jgi:hypothetical protein